MPLFRKLEKNVKHWKDAYDKIVIEKAALSNIHDKLEAEKAAMAEELAALKSQLVQVGQND